MKSIPLCAFAMLAAACGAETDSFDASEAAVRPAAAHYLVAADYRRCMYPACGGFWVAAANRSGTRCSDGRTRASCYVADIDFGGLDRDAFVSSLTGDLATAGGVVYGDLPRQKGYGTLYAQAAWRAPAAGTPTGALALVKDNGIRCFAAPCYSLDEAKLNSTTITPLAGLDLSGAPGTDADKALASEALYGAGLVAAGAHGTDELGATTLVASQFYLPLAAPVSKCDDPSRSYVSKDPNQCALIRYFCESGQAFSDECGCGCILP